MAVGAAALMGVFASVPSQAADTQIAYVEPAQMTPQLEAARMQPVALRPAYDAPALTNDLLAAYVQRQQQLKTFSSFDVTATDQLNEQVLLGYIDRTRAGTAGSSGALAAIDTFADKPALSPDVLSTYAQKKFVPTVAKVQKSRSEQLCLTQAIYHEARGESEQGQWAVANVIINRAMSKKFPGTLCGVVFQNADQGYHRCQFTFACDGKSDMGTERGAWTRATKLAAEAYSDFSQGKRPGIIPSNALYYHTTAVSPNWGNAKRVATIGAHEFYALN